MNASVSRRRFLRSGAVGAASFVGALQMLQTRQAEAHGRPRSGNGYGPIAPVNDLTTGLPLLQLPAGFQYSSFSWTGDLMRNQQPTPGAHDGMAVVGWGPRGIQLIRNHELGQGPIIDAPGKYDTAIVTDGTTTAPLAGGTTTLHLDWNGRWKHAEPSLGGTIVNCAGGPTPWGSWLTCEETNIDLTPLGGLRHGYVFEVRRHAGATTGVPLTDMGRFPHEAVAVDPRNHTVYLTEDSRNQSGFYRFIPHARGHCREGSLEDGGRLQMARAKGIANADLLTAQVGDTYQIEWVDIADPDADPGPFTAPDGGGGASGPFLQGWAQGALRMSRGEGIWHHNGKFYIVDTSTGVDSQSRPGRGEGAVWEYDPHKRLLKAIFVSTNAIDSNNPDNITVSPRGGILTCEDGGGVEDQFGFGDRLVGITRDGGSYTFAKNNIVLTAAQIAAAGKVVGEGDYRGNEFAGACFEPTGRILFVNIQTPGITFAIWGPWWRGEL
jgi:secreted PhoX family phosphatase